MLSLPEKIKQSGSYIKKIQNGRFEYGLILGTGLSEVADMCQDQTIVPYRRIPHFPVSTVPFHRSNWVMGTVSDKAVVVMQGRFHYYEGHSMQDITLPVRVMNELGVRKLVITCMAGSMQRNISEGDIAVITDHVNLMGNNPLIGAHYPELGERFPDMTEPYDPGYVRFLFNLKAVKSRLVNAVYLAIPGPSLPTAAEIKMYREFGDIVGMSVVPEVLVARQLGMRVCALAVISDRSTPEAVARVTPKSVRSVLFNTVPDIEKLVRSLLEKKE